MLSRSTFVLIVLLAVFLTYYEYIFKLLNIRLNSNSYPLAVGILSSQENFNQRQIIRETWLNVTNASAKNNYKAWFIIGDTSCDIPFQCRLNKYDCEKWVVNISEASEHFNTSVETPEKESFPKEFIFHQGFSFQVNHPVVITMLGLPYWLLTPNVSVSVVLKDLQTKEEVVKAVITVPNEINDKYVYKKVANFLLPKGYEGLFVVEGRLFHSSYRTMKWNNGSGAITFTQIYVSHNHFESLKFSENLQAAPSVVFTILDLKGFKEAASACENLIPNQQRYIKELSEKLSAENKKWNDIIFVNVVDTYRNLPQKLLSFYKWLDNNENFHSVLKTDDDCVIDIEKVLEKLKNRDQFNPKRMWIWSRLADDPSRERESSCPGPCYMSLYPNHLDSHRIRKLKLSSNYFSDTSIFCYPIFRFGWPINHIGKWADYEYKSPLYPMFPCGGGYVLSQSVVHWLSQNMQYLYPYQGEDVSLGIWVAAINPQFIQDENWQCDAKCSSNSYNRVQLNSTEILNSWVSKSRCRNICRCHVI